MSARRIVVVGTGTDVGKTFVTAALVGHIARSGIAVRGWKCAASGVIDRCEDAEALAIAAGRSVDAPLYTLRDPVSLHLAARRDGVAIDVNAMAARANELAKDVDVVVIETAGGLFSPLAPHVSNADAVLAFAPDALVLVAPDRLGVLHDIAATLLAAEHVGLHVAAIVLSSPAIPDEATGTNAAELAVTIGRTVASTFARGALGDDATDRAAQTLWRRVAG